MKLSVTQYDRIITIEDKNGDSMNLPDLHENMIRPLLLGMEFHPNTVDKLQFVEEEDELEHYTENMVKEEGYMPCVPWEQIEKKMSKKGYKEFLKWMEGSTTPIGGVYSWDLERYLNGLPSRL